MYIWTPTNCTLVSPYLVILDHIFIFSEVPSHRSRVPSPPTIMGILSVPTRSPRGISGPGLRVPNSHSINSNVKPVLAGSQGTFFFLPRALAKYEKLSRHLPGLVDVFFITFSFRVKPFNSPDFTGKVWCQAQLPNRQTSFLSPQMLSLKPQAFHDSREVSHTPHSTQLPGLGVPRGFFLFILPAEDSSFFSVCDFKLRRVV